MGRYALGEWKPVPGFPNYVVNRAGQVRNTLRHKTVPVKLCLDLPPYVELNHHGRYSRVPIESIMESAWPL